jgi:hypothetical protein
MKMLAECGDNLFGFTLAQQPVIDKHAGQAITDRLVNDQRRYRRVDPAGEGADHPSVTDLITHPRNRFGNETRRLPVAATSADTKREIAQHVAPETGMHHFGMELDAIPAPLIVTGSGKRRARAVRHDTKAGGQRSDVIPMAHPHLLVRWSVGKEQTGIDHRDLSRTELAALHTLNTPAERVRLQLHSIADAQNGEIAFAKP